MERFKSGVRVVAVLTATTLASLAQTSNGTIAGTVTDPSGAAITNATVVVKSLQTGDSRTVQSNAVGAYRVEALIPGEYVVTVSAPNFSNTTLNHVQVSGSVVTALNAPMQIGATETVNVEAGLVALQTETGDISQTIPSQEVRDLPVNSLNAYALARTLPGVTNVRAVNFTNGIDFSVNGTRPRANNYLIEGQDNNDAGIHGQGLQPNNLDAVKEVTVLTNSYSAEFGHGGGSVSNLLFKSGSNGFHGGAWDLLRNSALDANDHQNNLNGVDKPSTRENTFGFDLGGPIKKDKAFFFGSYQWDKFRGAQTGNPLTVPTEAGIATLGAIDPSASNVRIQNYIAAIGGLRGVNNTKTIDIGNRAGCTTLSTTGTCLVEVGQVTRTLGNSSETPELDLKGDYLISSSDTLNLRYIKNNFSTPLDLQNFPNQLPGFDTQQEGVAHNAGITETHIFSPSVLNELRLSYGRIGFSFEQRPDTLKNPLALGPGFTISGLTGYGVPSNIPQGRFHDTYQYQDSVSWTHGQHSMKFGADISDTRVRDQVPFNFFGTLAYNSVSTKDCATCTAVTGLSNYIDDFGGKSATVAHAFGNPVVRPRLVSQSYFAQDSWKLRPNLTVNYGMRYEYNGTPANVLAFPAMQEFNPTPSNYPFAIKESPDRANLGPRVGVAYTPKFWESLFGDNKTVIRAGFGVFYDGLFTNIIDNNVANAPNAVLAQQTSSVKTTALRGTANWSQVFANLSNQLSPTNTQFSIANHLLSPETLQWNFSIQRELPASFTLTTSYVGTRGEHQFAQNCLNCLDPNTGNFTNPNRGQVVIRDNSGDSIYHALQTQLDRKFSHGLLFRAAYTYSKMIDDASEIFTTGNWSAYPSVQAPVNRGDFDRGLSAFDVRNRVALTWVYDLPHYIAANNIFEKGMGHVANGWSVSGIATFQSGTPINVEDGFDNNGDLIGNDRPNLNNARAPLTSWAFDNGDGTFSDALTNATVTDLSRYHWVVPFSGPGNFGRNAQIGPGFRNWDLAVARSFSMTEKQQLVFRADMFNAFNQSNTDYTLVNATLLTGTTATGTNTFLNYPLDGAGNREIRFWLKYQF